MLQVHAGGATIAPDGVFFGGTNDLSIRADAAASSEPRSVARVLVVTACSAVHDLLKAGFEVLKREVVHAEQLSRLDTLIGPAAVDLLICDRRMLDPFGMSMLHSVRRAQPQLPVALLDDVDADIPQDDDQYVTGDALLTLPILGDDLDRLLRAAETRWELSTRLSPAHEFHGMFAATPNMREVFRRVRRVAPTDATVLVTGESGTGKELVARALHEESRRRNRPFVALNCSAIPSELIESELFGSTRGAFTGAVRDKMGLFEAANGGTLFLDEIGDLDPSAQAKVLRALESREVMRVGGTRPTAVDVRVIAATHRNLEHMVAHGGFREDLLYRLKVIGLSLPALRERSADVLLLATRFLRHFAERHGLPPKALSREVTEALLWYSWPGNIRELRNCMEGALVLSENDEIVLEDLPVYLLETLEHPAEGSLDVVLPGPVPSSTTYSGDLPFMEARELILSDFDRAYLTEALRLHGGNVAQTAKTIGVHRQSLQKLMTRRNIRAGGLGEQVQE
ncbi:MAG: sigma-54-dependent Fis family transcriptional regulator [Gemmatimonadaceae bacterium]|nr:sigma-54-dependent Fis family transcriptional regulator [Gemmatimonadaceae bacterium]